MSGSLILSYRPDGTRIVDDDLPLLLRLTQRDDPIWGWFTSFSEASGRFTRTLSHRVAGASIEGCELVLDLALAPGKPGERLRRVYDELRPLVVSPFLRGVTDGNGNWILENARIMSWDVYERPDQDSELDRILRAIQRGHLHRHQQRG